MSDLFRVLAKRDRVEHPPRREDGTPYTSINKMHKWTGQGNEPESTNKPAENRYQQKNQQEFQQEQQHPYQGDQPKQVSSSS